MFRTECIYEVGVTVPQEGGTLRSGINQEGPSVNTSKKMFGVKVFCCQARVLKRFELCKM